MNRRLRLAALAASFIAIAAAGIFMIRASAEKIELTDLSYSIQRNNAIYFKGNYQGKPVQMVRKGVVGKGKWMIFTGETKDRVRMTIDDRQGLQEIIAMDSGLRIAVNPVEKERVEYRYYAPDRKFISGAVLYRQDSRWLLGMMKTEAFPGYPALTDVTDMTRSLTARNEVPSIMFSGLQTFPWQGLSPIATAHAQADDDLARLWGDAPRDYPWSTVGGEMLKAAMVGVTAVTVKLVGQVGVGAAAKATGAAAVFVAENAAVVLVAAVPVLGAVTAGYVLGNAAYDYVATRRARNDAAARNEYTELAQDADQNPEPIEKKKKGLPERNNVATSQQRAGPQNNMLAQIQQLDKADFQEALDVAAMTAKKGFFPQAEELLNKAAKMPMDASDKQMLAAARQNLASEKARVAADAQLANAERQRAETERQRAAQAAERQRVAQAARTEAPRPQALASSSSGDFQLNKALAMGGAVAIFGGGKLSGSQKIDIGLGIIKDSMPGETGNSNAVAGVGGQGSPGSRLNIAAGSDSGGGSKTSFNPIEKACASEAKQTKPYNQPVMDAYCSRASYDACIVGKFDAGRYDMGSRSLSDYQAKLKNGCTSMKNNAQYYLPAGANTNLCQACQ